MDERLEAIKQRYTSHEYDFNLYKKDVVWLIKQAEAAIEWGKQLDELNQFLQGRAKGALGKQVIYVAIEVIKQMELRLKELEEVNNANKHGAKTFLQTAKELKREKLRYKQALEFYADKNNYQKPLIENSNARYLGVSLIENDWGEQARLTLKGDFHA